MRTIPEQERPRLKDITAKEFFFTRRKVYLQERPIISSGIVWVFIQQILLRAVNPAYPVQLGHVWSIQSR